MKISHVAAGMILSVLLGASAAHAQLNGRYAGQADGNDATGAALHQITLWTFEQGKLINFEEIISFPQSNGFTACLGTAPALRTCAINSPRTKDSPA